MIRALLSPSVLVLLIPLAAIIGHFIVKYQRIQNEHEERLAKIQSGLDPDLEEEVEVEEEEKIHMTV